MTAIRPALPDGRHLSARYLARAVGVLLVQLCLVLQGTGVGATLTTFVSLASEECNEESKCEVEVCAASHKCSRLKLASPNNKRTCQPRFSLVVVACKASLFVPSLCPGYLLGAGINLCC